MPSQANDSNDQNGNGPGNASQWNDEDASKAGSSAQETPNWAGEGWDPTIDPVLYDVSTTAGTAPLPVSSSTSELANALTFYQDLAFEDGDASGCISPAVLEESTPSPSTSSEPPRFCSVKGCKAVIPGSYDYKMCPSCRTRYRGYGITKRAKWKNEREAFEREMTQLRSVEDERRRANGLPPLADNPAELRAWEMSIIDEQITLPPQILAALNAAGINPDGTLSGEGSIVPSILSMYRNDPNQVSELSTPHSIAPYLSSIPPLPARMCTVSHCHQILPGYYRYKRCEQHRLQNRHHSKLKRVREKEEKAVGPKEGVQVVEIPPEAAAETSKKLKGKKKASTPTNDTEVADTNDPEAPKKSKKGVRPTHCTSDGCNNPLSEEKRWRKCEDCRWAERRKKTQGEVAARQLNETPPQHEDAPVRATEDTTTPAPDAPPPANAAPQEFQLVNMTANTFDRQEPTLRWKEPTSMESPAPAVDLSQPSTSRQPLMIRQYRPKGDEPPGSRPSSSHPYVIVEQFPFKDTPTPAPAAEGSSTPSAPSLTQIVTSTFIAEEVVPGSGNKQYPDAGVFRHYVVPEDARPDPVPTPVAPGPIVEPVPPSPPPLSTSTPIALPIGVEPATENHHSATLKKSKQPTPTEKKTTKPRAKSNGKTPAATTTSGAPLSVTVSSSYPYPQYPLHPYFYLPPQYGVNGYGFGYAPAPSGSAHPPESASAAGKVTVGPEASSSVAMSPNPHMPLHPYSYPFPYPYASPFGPTGPSVPGHGQPPIPPAYYYPPYPYSASAPPFPGLGGPHPHPSSGPQPQLVPYQIIGGPGTSISAPLATSGGGASSSTSISAPPDPAPASASSAPPSASSTPSSKLARKDPTARKFNYYHPGYGTTDSPDAPVGLEKPERKKRRKIDPAWSEKMRLRAEEGAAAARAAGNENGDSATLTDGPLPGVSVSAPHAAVLPASPTLPAAASAHPSDQVQDRHHHLPPLHQQQHIPRISETETEQTPGLKLGGDQDEDDVLPGEREPSPGPSAQWKPCSNKTCRRRAVSSSASATAFCEKCKTRFKKHSDKNKRKHKLVPIKLVQATTVGVDIDTGVS